jgi:hypothetical protein
VNLTLTGESQSVLENCSNGIDDDGDGAIDCADTKCVLSPFCMQSRCVPDFDLGTLGMSTQYHYAGTTKLAGDNQQVACATSSGGEDLVVNFTLPQKADLEIDWSQTGSHAFAIYADADDRLPCDAGQPKDCRPASGLASGSYSVSALPAGKYHLVIDADGPTAAGTVTIGLLANPSP